MEHIERVENKIGNILENRFIEQFNPSTLERDFWDYWIKNYYPNKKNPFLFPEISGERTSERYGKDDALFIAYEDNESNIFSVSQKQGLINQDINHFKTSVRFDFGVINETKQVKQIIELNSDKYHRKNIMINKDPVKRSIATGRGWKYCEVYAEKESGIVNIEKAFSKIHDSLIVE